MRWGVKMNLKKCMTIITAGSIMVTSMGGEVTVSAVAEEAVQQTQLEQETVEQEMSVEVSEEINEEVSEEAEESEQVTMTPEPSEESEEPEESEDLEFQVSNVKAEYNERTKQITLTWDMEENASVKIYVNDKLEEEDYKRTSYVYDVSYQGMDYAFEVVPKGQNSGEKVVVSVGYGTAILESVEADYDLEKKILLIEWDGENIAYADVYQDDVLLAEQVTGDRLLKEITLEALSSHTYKVVPYNGNKEPATAKTIQYQVDDYKAAIEDFEVKYDAKTKQIVMEWQAKHTAYVDICINDEEVVTSYKANKYVLNYQLQSGAVYNINICPYNQKNDAGDDVTEQLQQDDFETPYINSVKERTYSATDANGNYTGFKKPAAEIIWTGEENAVYEIYRGEKDQKTSYRYIGKLKSTKDGTCSYLDKTIGAGDYYYKIRKVIVEDRYISQEIATALSESDSVTITVPRAKLQAKLAENNTIEITLGASKSYVSGYDIYKKTGNGKYKKVAGVTGNTWQDTNITFENVYKYKARAYYYDEKTGKKAYGEYSKISTVKSALGDVELKVNTMAAKKVKVSWKEVANADGYEVYYKSGVQGDGFKLVKDTKKLSFTKEFKKSGTYIFQIKAYKNGENGERYFSSAEITYQTGFTAPSGFKVSKTKYQFDKKKNTLIQKSILSWERVYGADGYYIECYNAAKKKYETIATIKKGNTTEYVLEHIVAKKAVTDKYRITAYCENKKLPGSTVKIKPQLGSTEKLKAKRNGNKVQLSWSAVVGAEKYNVYRSNGRSMVLIETTDKTQITDQGLSLGVTYTYYVKAVNESLGFQGKSSKGVKFTIPLAKVEKFSATNPEAGIVSLKWSKVTDADKYVIYYSKERNGTYKKLAEVKKGTTSYFHKKLTPDQTIYYKVTAVKINAGGSESESKKSAVAQVYVKQYE